MKASRPIDISQPVIYRAEACPARGCIFICINIFIIKLPNPIAHSDKLASIQIRTIRTAIMMVFVNPIIIIIIIIFIIISRRLYFKWSPNLNGRPHSEALNL